MTTETKKPTYPELAQKIADANMPTKVFSVEMHTDLYNIVLKALQLAHEQGVGEGLQVAKTELSKALNRPS